MLVTAENDVSWFTRGYPNSSAKLKSVFNYLSVHCKGEPFPSSPWEKCPVGVQKEGARQGVGAGM
jgi:hypothetical protein